MLCQHHIFINEHFIQMSRLSGPASLQPELLARSGFQPYRPDERLTHTAGAFPLDAYPSPFGPIPGMPPGLYYFTFFFLIVWKSNLSIIMYRCFVQSVSARYIFRSKISKYL